MNNRGLQISLPLLGTRSGYIHQAILNCRSVNDPARVFLLNLYHVEGNEYCVMDGHQPRCTEVDWWDMPNATRIDTLDNELIVIRKDWEEFCRDDMARWEMILRLEDTGCSLTERDKCPAFTLPGSLLVGQA